MTAILCSFSDGLDDMPRKQQADPIAVLRVLKRAGRFSAFEASDNMVIARTITNLFHKSLMGRGRMLEMDNSMGYPWTKVVLTPAAEQLLAELDATLTPKEAP